MLRSAPVAFLWTLMSLLRASLVRGTSAPLFAILLLFSSANSENTANVSVWTRVATMKDEG